MHQRTWEESRAPTHQEIGIRTLILAVDPEVPHDLAPAPFTMIWELLANMVLDSHPWMRASVEVVDPAEKFNGKVRRTIQLYLPHPSSRQLGSVTTEHFLACDFPWGCGGK